MTDKQTIINGIDANGCEYYNTKEYPFDCNIFDCNCEEKDCHYKRLKRKEQECEELRKKLNPKLSNAHCTYFEGQTGLCRAKEFTKCNPVNCKLYTIDELSTIVDLQQQLEQLEAENEKLKKDLEEESKLAHKECQNEANTFFELLKVTKESGQFKADNEKLKNELQQYKKLAKEHLADCFELKEENNKLKQALEEIKKFTIKYYYVTGNDNYLIMNDIKNIISKAKDGEND